MKAMKNLIMPKLIKDDEILFEGLLKDLFPDLDYLKKKKNIVKEIMKSMT